MTRRVAAAVAAIAFVTAGAAPAAAQYFGQNKVQYESFDFKVLKTDHFDIYYYSQEEAAVRTAARMAERWYARLSKVLGHQLSSRQPLVLYAAHPHFQQTNVLGGPIGEGTGGVTESAKRRIVMPFAGGLAETDHVLGHELVHAFQYDMALDLADGRAAASAFGSLPLWFVEGMAEYLSIGPVDAHTAMWMRDAAAREKLPTVRDLDNPNFFPYRYGHAFWAYVAGRWGDDMVGSMFRSASTTGSINDAMQNLLKVDEKEFTTAWHADTRRTYAPLIETTRPPATFGRPLITRDAGGGDLNVAPSVSPDGRKMVFLSERSLFAIEMYVADVATGRVERKLVETAGDPHFESLQFIESAGDWAPDNRRFVFAALSKGQPVLSIVDTTNGDRLGEHEFKDLDQIFNPAWSPDGRAIAFSGMAGGLSDLYLFDLESRQLTRLTNDQFADYDPEWAPNGRELAWVTDRFTANTDTLEFGGYRIGLMDIASRNAREVAGFATGRNTNPEYSFDGRSLFFIATPDGIPNIYKLDLAGGSVQALTNVTSGVSGITPLTPALSLAADGDHMVFTIFEGDKYNIYAIEGATQIPGTAAASLPSRNAAPLPPVDRKPGPVMLALQSPTAGLPPPQTFNEEEYRAGLSLDMIAQPTVGVGYDRWGAFGTGGLALIFSDMLGNHELGMYVQVNSRFSEIGGALQYINRKNRWNWGFIVENTPYVTGSFGQGLAVVDNQVFFAEQELRVVQINRGVTGLVQYPLNRAQRIELSSGFRRISFDRQLETRLYSTVTGNFVDEIREELDRPDSLNLAESSGALVYDTSVFGATSPILGQRYRLEYTQSAGSLLYSGVLADYRKYFMPLRPFTLAFRGLHYGRYGRDGEDARLSPIFAGYPSLVRGYDVDSFEASECFATAESSCPVFDQLIGSRIAVASAEVRFPLVGVFSRRTYYGPLPIEIAFFGDAGVAWDSETEPQFFGGSRDVVRSVGTAVRFNLFGYVIGEIDYVKPLDRPERGWLWQFNFIPGF
jgi:hypothetical protein